MIDNRLQEFCVVGLGNHALTKVIPALRANGQTLAAVVSRRGAHDGATARTFATVQQALEALPATTAFFVATPPPVHFEQAMAILGRGVDLFLEKPAFVTRRDAVAAAELCAAGEAVLVEALMHRYTELYAEFFAIWSGSRDQVRRIDIDFLIDRLPGGTFRSESDVACSAMFDIGCYPLSLLADMGLGEARLDMTDVQFPATPDKVQIRISGQAGDIEVGIRIGMSDAYENSVRLHMDDGRALSFFPFFYGREATRTIQTASDGRTTERTFVDADAFRAMLAMPRAAWRESQPARLRQIVEVTERLEAFGALLDRRRANT